jgi:hypothetical protein
MNINETQMGLLNKLLETAAGLLQPYMKLDVDTYQIEETVKEEMHDVAREAAEDALRDRFDDLFCDGMSDNDVITNDTIGDYVQSEDDINDLCSDQIRRVLEHDVSIRMEVD